MRIGRKTFGLVLLMTLSFASGAITSGMMRWSQPEVHVTIANESGEDLTRLKFSYESGGTTGTVTLPVLRQGQTTDVRFFISGEGSYQVEAAFLDGQVIKGSEAYIESGYSTKEIVGKTKITSQKYHL